jgi:uncharacterized lipoprotein (TIGR02269 family)
LLLLWALVASCASTPPLPREEETATSWEEACEDARSLVFLCGGDACAFYRCRDVAPGRLVHTYANAPVARPVQPTPGASAQRNWGSAMGLPGHAQPVFVIPWNNDTPQRFLPLFSAEQLQDIERAKGHPTEKHHIFPQEKELKLWFESKKINIHQWTLVLLKEDHDRIHRGPKGGPWNEAWRQYRDNNFDASKEEIWRYAGELIHRFALYGPVFPYYRRERPSPTPAAP